MPPPLPPPRLRLASLLERRPGIVGLKSDQKPILFLNHFAIPFWTDFLSHLGAFLDPFWHQKSPKFHQNVISNLICVKNVNAHEIF